MSERSTPAGEFFAWRPAGVGSLRLPCARCGAGAPVRLLENLLEVLCPQCGRNVALERIRQVEQERGATELAALLVRLGVLGEGELEPLREEGELPQPLVDRLIDEGALRRDLRLTLDLDLSAGTHAYEAAPLRDVVGLEEIERALETRRERGGALTELLRELVLGRLAASIRSVGGEVGLEVLASPDAIEAECRDAVPTRALEIYRAVPVRWEAADASGARALVVAMWSPLEFGVISDLEALIGAEVRPILAEPEVLADAMRALGVERVEAITAEVRDAQPDELSPWEYGGDPFDGILLEALEEGAQEVLIEPRGSQASVRLRVGGELRKERTAPAEIGEIFVERLAGLAGSRTEGTLSRIRSGGGRCEISGLPVVLSYRLVETPLGASIAVELEGEGERRVTQLGQLGLSLEALAELEAVLASGRGLIVVAAPRRQGKTQAYQAILQRLVRLGQHMISLERRVGRVVPGVTQLDIEPAFADRLDTLLHPVPDWLGIDGSVRPAALRLAVDVVCSGGGSVLTVPAPDAASALLRLEMAGVPRELLQRAVPAVLARRVVSPNCAHCRVERQAFGGKGGWIGLGCAACADQGSAGWLPLAELVRPTEEGFVPIGSSPLLRDRALELVQRGDVRREALADLLS